MITGKTIFCFFKRLSGTHLQAGVLQLTLGIGIVISILCASMILLAFYSHLVFLGQNIDDKLRNNAASGIQYAMANRHSLAFGVPQTLDLFDDEIDTVDILRKPWGVFEVISSTARHYNHTASQAAFVAASPNDYGKAVIYTPENNSPIYLAGNALITGTAYLPERKLSTGYVNGKDFAGKRLMSGEAKISKREMLKLDSVLLDEIVDLVNKRPSGYHIRELDRLPINTELPFHSKESNYYHTNSQLRIAEALSGNLIVHCTERLTVSEQASLSDVILIARDIDIEEGFKGSIQCFATRTITVGRNVSLEYPSTLMLLNGIDSLILVREDAKVNGYVIIPGFDLSIGGRGIFKLDKKGSFHGMAYVNGSADIQGTFSGHITTKLFMASAGTGKYTNHILDGRINGESRSPNLPATLMWANARELTVAKWVK